MTLTIHHRTNQESILEVHNQQGNIIAGAGSAAGRAALLAIQTRLAKAEQPIQLPHSKFRSKPKLTLPLVLAGSVA